MNCQHNELKQYAKIYLLNRGFKPEEIHEEHPISKYKVDVVGINNSSKIAVECGNTEGKKVAVLSELFDEVILLGRNVKVLSSDAKTSEEQKLLLEQNNLITKLQEKIKELEPTSMDSLIPFVCCHYYV